MTNKELKRYLLDNDFVLEKESYYTTTLDHTKIINEYYISSNDECVNFTRIGKGKEIICLITGWEHYYIQAGHIVKYGALPDDVIAFVKDSEKYEQQLLEKAKEVVASYSDNESCLPFC